MAKARKISGLNPNAPVKGSAAKILRARFEEMTVHEQGTIDGSDIEDYDVFIEKLEKMKEQSGQSVSSNKNDNRAIDLLIVRKKAEREQKRKLLIQNINTLNKKGYKEHFISFVSTNLEQKEVSNPKPVNTVSNMEEAQ